ncbi:MAG: methyltransferase domain-containing protein [Fusobacterium necrophorum]|nr:methyltransferase domain-containing protein [Fusobacterium necrophorum]
MEIRNKPGDFLMKILEMPYLSIGAKTLVNALRLGVFEELKNSKTSEELAKIKNWNEKNTKIFLQTLRALNYIEKEKEQYKNTADTNKYLVKNSEDYAGGVLETFGTDLGGVFHEDISALLERNSDDKSYKFQNNENGEVKVAHTEEEQMDFSKMENAFRMIQSGYNLKQMKELLNQVFAINKGNRLLDLGCGAGMYSLSFAKEHPNIQLSLYDMPVMETMIHHSIDLSDMKERTKLITGDFTKDDIGSGYDVIFSSSSIYAAKHCLDDFMEKIYNALNSNGIFICIADGIEEDYSKPWDMVVSWFIYRMKDMHMEVGKDMVKDSAIKAGFVSLEKISLISSGGHLDIDILQKIVKE